MGENQEPCTFHDAVKFTIIGMLYGGLLVFVAMAGLGAFEEKASGNPGIGETTQAESPFSTE